MTLHVGIVGAGLVGRLAALECVQRGWRVDLFDRDTCYGHTSCGWTAAGMLAPFTELESSEWLICQLGLDSLALWPQVLAHLDHSVEFHLDGTLVVAHPQDASELSRFEKILRHRISNHRHCEPLPKACGGKLREASQTFIANHHSTGLLRCARNDEGPSNFLQAASRQLLEELAPGLSPNLRNGFWLPQEGHINNIDFFHATTDTLARSTNWHENTLVHAITPHKIKLADKTLQYDLVIDCRGLGAKKDIAGLRGVRGEVIWLTTTEVKLQCPIRILHPRYPIYIAPRSDNVFVIGATTIESEDRSPISAQSMLELLSAAYTVHPGFAEARITNTLTNCRPAFADQVPKIFQQPGLLSINGLYRHGYLVGPAVVQDALRLFESGKIAMHYPTLLSETEEMIPCKLS